MPQKGHHYTNIVYIRVVILLMTVDHYVYLGQLVDVEGGQQKELRRRVSMTWSKFGKLGKYLQDHRFPLALKKKIFMQTVIPTLLYAAETWTTTKAMESKIRSTQLSMERKMLGISWKDRVRNTTVKEKTKLPDVLQMLKTSKWNWAGHAARANNNWALSVIKWDPIGKRKRGRPKARWTTDIVKYCGDNWAAAAENWDLWCIKREAFVQQWNLWGWRWWWWL